MTQSDEEFFRHLHKQLEQQRQDKDLTTLRILQKRSKNNNNNTVKNNKPKSK